MTKTSTLKYNENGLLKTLILEGDVNLRVVDRLYTAYTNEISITFNSNDFVSLEKMAMKNIEEVAPAIEEKVTKAVKQETPLVSLCEYIEDAQGRSSLNLEDYEFIGESLCKMFGPQGEIKHSILNEAVPGLYHLIRKTSKSEMSYASARCRINDIRKVYYAMHIRQPKFYTTILRLAGVKSIDEWLRKGNAYASLAKFVSEAEKILEKKDTLKGF